MESEHAEAIVEVMGQSVSQLVTREHFDTELRLTREHFDAGIAKFRTELHARIDTVQAELHARIDTLEARISGVDSKVKSLEATVRAEMMRAVLITVGILIPAIGLMIAIAEFYSARGGGA